MFSKTNGYRHAEAIPAADALLATLARQNHWGYFQTENGAAFSPDILSQFDAVVFNNVTGDVFTPAQRGALQHFIENGGGWVGIHGSGDNSHKAWPWYEDTLIGTRFIGHPLNPQFQTAQIVVEDRSHPATARLPARFAAIDEWYSFDNSLRAPGFHVLLTLDERSYRPKGWLGQNLAMGRDHPLAWWHCVGRGRVLYTARGHLASSYEAPDMQAFLVGALSWALGLEGASCENPR